MQIRKQILSQVQATTTLQPNKQKSSVTDRPKTSQQQYYEQVLFLLLL